MKRALITSIAVLSLACGSTTKGSGSGAGGTSVPAGSSGGSGGSTGITSSSAASGGNSGSGGGSGGAVDGGAPGTGARGGSGGGAGAGSGGRTGTLDGGSQSGGRTGTDAAAGSGGGPGIDGGSAGAGGTAGKASGGTTGKASGGAAGNSGPVSSGGVAGTGGVAGVPGTIATGPTVKDPTTAAEGLTKYYVSNSGKDTNPGTSPEQAWATVTNIPKDKPSAVYFERGGTFTAAGAPAIGRDGPTAFTVPKGSVWAAYGTGEKRPILKATEKTAGKVTGAVLSPAGNVLLAGLSFTGRANFGLLIMSDGNVVQDCEIDGDIEESMIQLGFSVRGNNNRIVGNYIHSLHVVILDSGNVNTSGGAEAIVVNGTNQEIAYNTIEDCWTPNETLGGAEGGCLEVIARAPGEVVSNVTFHHNYCAHAVGLFEACSGNFAGTAEKVQEKHAVLKDTTLAYNVVVDAMWLYLLQTANTDMQNLVFEHNTLVHGPANTDIPQKGAPGFGNFYDTDVFIPSKTCSAAADCSTSSYALCLNGSCYYQAKAQPGQIKVRNNLFVVLEGATAATMKLPPGADDVVANIFSPKAPSGVTASAGKVTVVTDSGLVDTFRLGPSSPAIDKGSKDAVQAWPDFDNKSVPCGNEPDVGAIEYCP